MGMYSTYESQQGLEMSIENTKKVVEYCTKLNHRIPVTYGVIDFEHWDEMKLESYYYKETMDVLYYILERLENVTNDIEDNFVQFEYEEGYSFRIGFVLINGERKVVRQVEERPVFSTPHVLEKER